MSALLILFICVILHTMPLGKSPHPLCILPFGIVFILHHDDVCENYIGSVYVGGHRGLSESGPCVLDKLCLVGFLVGGVVAMYSRVVC